MTDEHPDQPRFEPGDYYTAHLGGTPPLDAPPADPSPPGLGDPPVSDPPSAAPPYGTPPGGLGDLPAAPPAPPGPPPGGTLAYSAAPPYPPAGYPPAGYPVPYPGQPYYPPPMAMVRPTNTMAIMALIMLFVLPPLAIVFGAIARSQIRRTNEEGSGMATAGLIGGIVLTALYVLAIVLMIVFWVALFSSAATAAYSY